MAGIALKDRVDLISIMVALEVIAKEKIYIKAHCRDCDWQVAMLKSKTKLWPVSNYQAFMLLDHTLFRE